MSDIVFDLNEDEFPLGRYPYTGEKAEALPTADILELKMSETAEALAGMGLENATRYTPVHTDAPKAPVLQASYKGETVYICFPMMAEGFYEIGAIPLDTAEYFERHMPEATLCHAAFYLEGRVSAVELHLFGCQAVRVNGQWQDMPGWDDHIPFAKRKFIPRLDTVFGPLALAKISSVASNTIIRGKDVDFGVEGLYGPADSADSPVVMRMHPRFPNFIVQGAHDPETGRFIPHSNWVNMEDPQLSEVELLDVQCQSGTRGVVILAAKNGVEINAECIECTVLPEVFKPGQRFEGNVVLYADQCIKAPVHNLYQSFRHFAANKHKTKAAAIGVVESAEWKELGFSTVLCIRLGCMPDNGDFHLHVYAHRETLGDYTPQAGDLLACHGHVQFICTRRIG